MIDDQLITTEQASGDEANETNSIFDREDSDIELEEAMLDSDKIDDEVEPVEKQELYLDDLGKIDELYEQIEKEIAELAEKEQKEVSVIQNMLEAAAD